MKINEAELEETENSIETMDSRNDNFDVTVSELEDQVDVVVHILSNYPNDKQYSGN